MAFARLVNFDRPLANAVLPGQGGQRCYTEAELAEMMHQAYRKGVDATRAAADHQMVELRSDMEMLSDGVLRKLSQVEPGLVSQVREALPGLALDIAQRLLSGFEPPPEIVERACREALDQLFPEREGLELALSPADHALLTRIDPEWLKRYPGLRMRSDPALGAGDCLVRSRFGLIDARRQTKLASLEHSLTAG